MRRGWQKTGLLVPTICDLAPPTMDAIEWRAIQFAPAAPSLYRLFNPLELFSCLPCRPCSRFPPVPRSPRGSHLAQRQHPLEPNVRDRRQGHHFFFPGQDTRGGRRPGRAARSLVVGSYNLVRLYQRRHPRLGFRQPGCRPTTPISRPTALAVQSGDKIVVVGYRASLNIDFIVARYDAKRRPRRYLRQRRPRDHPPSGSYATAAAVVVQTDGKILVAGGRRRGRRAGARYNTNGSLDDGGVNDITPGDSFGNGGKRDCGRQFFSVTSSQALALQSDGMILVVGRISNGGINDFALARLTSTGALDAGVSGNGGVVFHRLQHLP